MGSFYPVRSDLGDLWPGAICAGPRLASGEGDEPLGAVLAVDDPGGLADELGAQAGAVPDQYAVPGRHLGAEPGGEGVAAAGRDGDAQPGRAAQAEAPCVGRPGLVGTPKALPQPEFLSNDGGQAQAIPQHAGDFAGRPHDAGLMQRPGTVLENSSARLRLQEVLVGAPPL